MPTLRTIALNRTGLIKVRVAGNRHCGAQSAVVDGAVPVRYAVHLVIAPNGLDASGFLVDQEALHTVMLDIGMDPVPWREPCELLTEVWGERLLTWISTANTWCDILSFTLTLSPSPHLGSFTAHYEHRALDSSIALPRRALRLVA